MKMKLLVSRLHLQTRSEQDHEHPLQHHLQNLEDRAVVYVTITLLKLKKIRLQLSLKYYYEICWKKYIIGLTDETY